MTSKAVLSSTSLSTLRVMWEYETSPENTHIASFQARRLVSQQRFTTCDGQCLRGGTGMRAVIAHVPHGSLHFSETYCSFGPTIGIPLPT